MTDYNIHRLDDGTLAGWQTDLWNLIQYQFPEQKGRAITTGLATGGFARDRIGMMQYYETNRDVVDGYLDFIDVAALLNPDPDSVGGRRLFNGSFLLGLGFGAVVVVLLKSLQQ